MKRIYIVTVITVLLVAYGPFGLAQGNRPRSAVNINLAVPQPETSQYGPEGVQEEYEFYVTYAEQEGMDRVLIKFFVPRVFDRSHFGNLFKLNDLPVGTYSNLARNLKLEASLDGANYEVKCKSVSEPLRKMECTFYVPEGILIPDPSKDDSPEGTHEVSIGGAQKVEDSNRVIENQRLSFPVLDLGKALVIYVMTEEEYGAPDEDGDGVFDDIDQCPDKSEVYDVEGGIADGIEDGCPDSTPTDGSAPPGDGGGQEVEEGNGDGGGWCSLDPNASVNAAGFILLALGSLPLFIRKRLLKK